MEEEFSAFGGLDDFDLEGSFFDSQDGTFGDDGGFVQSNRDGYDFSLQDVDINEARSAGFLPTKYQSFNKDEVDELKNEPSVFESAFLDFPEETLEEKQEKKIEKKIEKEKSAISDNYLKTIEEIIYKDADPIVIGDDDSDDIVMIDITPRKRYINFDDERPFKKRRVEQGTLFMADPDEESSDIEEEDGKLILDRDPEISVPAGVNSKLRDYQQKGVKFLYKLYKQNKGGILGDEMGLGKTIQTISFLLAITTQNPEQPILITVPASCLHNWEREIETWTAFAEKEFKVVKYFGSKRMELLKKMRKGKFDIIITSYETLRNDILDLRKFDWLCVVFDEVHKIKGKKAKITQACQSLNTLKRYGLTGTVMQNNFVELWTLLNFVQPDSLGDLPHFRKEFINVIKKGHKKNAEDVDLLKAKLATKRLNKVVKSIVLRRDSSIIEDLLPGKTDHIVFCKMSPLQITCYRRLIQSDMYQKLISLNNPCACGSFLESVKCCLSEKKCGISWKKEIFPSITTVLKLSQHLQLLVPQADSSEDTYQRSSRIAEEAFGEDKEKIMELIEEGKHPELSGKMKALEKLLEIWSKGKRKVLIFSTSTKILDIIEKFIQEKDYMYCRLDGSTPTLTRQPIIDEFNENPDQFLFIISTKAGGLGLNITSASIVVVFDASWNASQDLQAQNRVYRIGQTRHCDIYRFISVGSIEEMVYNRQVYKQQLSNIGVHGTHERRYFQGVHGVKGEEGEIFGLINLLKLTEDKILSKELVDEAKKNEEKEMYQIKLSQLKEGKKDGDGKNDMDILFKSDDEPINLTNFQRQDPDILRALRESGVEYTHHNEDIVGGSKLEEEIVNYRQKQTQLLEEEGYMDKARRDYLRDISRSGRYRPIVTHPKPMNYPSQNHHSFNPALPSSQVLPLPFENMSTGFNRSSAVMALPAYPFIENHNYNFDGNNNNNARLQSVKNYQVGEPLMRRDLPQTINTENIPVATPLNFPTTEIEVVELGSDDEVITID
eukprot:TRINITY_DN3886_c0_g1_i2.p1 TRINITY_DN3886_c0_g1~~TRINITY_DN3886_c0_g1_i2.p1  ORF type:complete len:1005 (+),score=232.62 TRINITY_DN3886_c0_g1_i2:1-3015(+)